MKRAFDPTAVNKVLRRGIDNGWWTLEDLDRPAPFHCNPSTYRNPLRDPGANEAVQVSDPRDFTPAAGATPAEPSDLPLNPPPDLTGPATDFDF